MPLRDGADPTHLWSSETTPCAAEERKQAYTTPELAPIPFVPVFLLTSLPTPWVYKGFVFTRGPPRLVLILV
jgi:hypothetical protein